MVGDGSFDIEVADLSFSSPVRPLEFRRSYNSRSRERSGLGSGWQHNWDVRIQVLNAENAPTWTLPYAAGAKGSPTALILHNGSGNKTLFFLDFATQLFMPQAGSADTITKTTEGGWALRRADGGILIFNAEGFLVSDRDRFGNGFAIEYERTALYELYLANCGLSDPAASLSFLPGDPSSSRSRYCPALAYLLGEGVRPLPNSTALSLDNLILELPLPRATSTLYDPLSYARAYFEHLLRKGPLVQASYGERKLRPTKVTDDLGRTLILTYYHADNLDFAGTPHAELLASVLGPAGTTITFSYDRPSNLPAELNEQFLTWVYRQDMPSSPDIVAAPRRTINYAYQWPGSAALSFDSGNWAQEVYDRYFQFYRTFIGCVFEELACPGELPHSYRSPGDPAVLARFQRDEYISDIAGNIIQVFNSGVPESETRFEVNPFAANFDHVTAQRYGSRQANQDPSTVPPDMPSDQWQTTLPKGVFTYQSAGPVSGGGDLTDGFLPSQILDRYPLETLVVVPPPEPILAAVSPGASVSNACNYAAMEPARTNVPGYTDTVPYYDPIPAETHPDFCLRLFRSRLTSEQLALAQLSDPTHNDLLSTLHPVVSTDFLNDHAVSRIVGRRKFVAANANRICNWVQFINRDGDGVYYGLNYRGQVLVEALKERGGLNLNYIFTEHLYNADGLMVQTRRPTSGPQPWTPLAGSTLFKYDEIEPRGNRGWNEWLPVFWSRRANLLRVEEVAAGGEVWDELEASGALVKRAGRYRRIGYEPLFNQVKFVEEGTLEQAPSQAGSCGARLDHPDASIHFVFDYQELAYGEADLKPVLDHFLPWGFRWVEKPALFGTLEYDYTTIQQWQLPLNFYDLDLNGDGQRGFAFGTNAFERARGVPVVAIRTAPAGSTNTEVSFFTWAPHGRVAAALGPAGSLTVREYYSIGHPVGPHAAVYGQPRPPTDQEVNAGFRGFLARTRVLRFSTNAGPAFTLPDSPNAALKGPYQWLLPSAYAGSLTAGLTALGLPPETVQAIQASVNPASAEHWLTTSFSYSEIGEPRYFWTDTTSDHIVRDTDGREITLTDSLQNVTTVQYTLLGYPFRSVTIDATGTLLLRDVRREFDDAGNVLSQCDAFIPGACDAYPGVVHRFTYWPEGGLRSTTDPEETVTEYRYNELQLLVSQRTFHPGHPNDTPRETQYQYNADGDLTSILHGVTGTPTPTPTLTQTFAYDGLRRLVTRVNTRGIPWQFAYTTRDLLTRRKQSLSSYGTPNPLPASWESVYRFDEFERPVSTTHNGITVSQVARSPGGRIYASWGAGRGTNYFTYDAAGQLVWNLDAVGNQTVHTWSPAPHVATTSIVRTNPSLGRLTTASIQDLDPRGLSVREVEYASGLERVWHYQRRGDGVVTNTINPEGYNTWVQHNLLGWPLAIGEQNPPAYDVAYFQYNKRGQPLSVRDPGGQTTTLRYNGFGQLDQRETLGQVAVVSDYQYDVLGRLESETYTDGTIQHSFQANGDPHLDRWITPGGTKLLAFRRFDNLGRVYSAYNYNPAFPAPEVDRIVEENLEFDDLSRVSKDTVRVGRNQPIVLESVWSLAASDSWRRAFGINGGLQSAWEENYDSIGRMARIERFPTGNNRSATTFDWLGEIYAGRAQNQGAGHVSPFRERRQFDAFGSPLRWTYSAIDLDSAGNPLDASEGAAFCGGGWNPNCGRPLLEMNAVREVSGRIASLQRAFGGPQTTAQTPKPWRGYTYNAMAQLHRTWEHSGIGTTIDTTLLPNHFVTASQIAAVGQTAELWNYEREPNVGGTTAIRNQVTGATRWGLVSPRGPGHQLTAINDGANNVQLLHDGRGRVAAQDTTLFVYDPRGSLAAVRTPRPNQPINPTNYVTLEAYLYDPQGRLAAVIGTPDQAQSVELMANDGPQMIAALDEFQVLRWEAMWGPLIDQILEWNNHADALPPRIPLLDHRNSVASLWQPDSTSLTQTLNYDPEGRLSIQTLDGQTTCSRFCKPPADIPFTFGSAWTSQRTGLVYLRNRWYSPELGQFLSHDPEGFADSYSPYAYAAFDPINATDPFGLQASGLSDRSSRVQRQGRANNRIHRYTEPGGRVLQRPSSSRVRIEVDPGKGSLTVKLPDVSIEADVKRRSLKVKTPHGSVSTDGTGEIKTPIGSIKHQPHKLKFEKGPGSVTIENKEKSLEITGNVTVEVEVNKDVKVGVVATGTLTVDIERQKETGTLANLKGKIEAFINTPFGQREAELGKGEVGVGLGKINRDTDDTSTEIVKKNKRDESHLRDSTE